MTGDKVLPNHVDHAIEHGVITASGYVTKGSGGVAIVSGAAQKVAENADVLSLADKGIVVGMIGVIMGLVINGSAQWVKNRRDAKYQKLRYEMERELQQERIAALHRDLGK